MEQTDGMILSLCLREAEVNSGKFCQPSCCPNETRTSLNLGKILLCLVLRKVFTRFGGEIAVRSPGEEEAFSCSGTKLTGRDG